ncbi:MAG: D-amino-acid transaminase [Ancalomicrobiaceae bacterium]|nr:D-amino-acid transaminase [Ancalomicrobiaceae bacterium]
MANPLSPGRTKAPNGRIAYVNGRYLPHAHAFVHIEDRGYQFADAVYEACEVRDGAIIDLTRHLDRLDRSLDALQMLRPMSRPALAFVIREVVGRNLVSYGSVYLQVGRGVARRDHPFPATPLPPSLVITAKHGDRAKAETQANAGIGVITLPDNRWGRVDIKTVGLLPNVLAKQAAREAGAREAWFIDADGYVTEGGSSNAWIVTAEGVLVTRQASTAILSGITRAGVLDVAEAAGLKVELRRFTVAEAKSAREAFVTSASQIVLPVVMIDGDPVANGHPGTIALNLRRRFHDVAEATPATK